MWESFQKFIPKAAGKYDFTRTLKAIDVCREYRGIASRLLPADAADNTFPLSYKDRTLTLGALSPAWAQELNLKRHLIQKELNDRYKEEIVQKISIRISERLPGTDSGVESET